MFKPIILMLSMLLLPYFGLGLAGRLLPRLSLDSRTRMKVSLTLVFLFTGALHFVIQHDMANMIPPFIPYRLEIVYLTGVLEFLGAAGIWVPSVERLTGWCLIAFLVSILPANVYMCLYRVPVGGLVWGPEALLLRIPLQFFLMVWVYKATGLRLSKGF